MITFTGDPIYIGDKRIFSNATTLLYDCLFRNDTSVVAVAYAQVSGEIIATFETAYTAAEVNAESTSETSYTGKFNQAVQQLEKARLEARNPSNTFTITL